MAQLLIRNDVKMKDSTERKLKMLTESECKQSLRNLENINLDIVLDELGYEKAEQVSWYGMNDYPTLEKQGDIDVLRELIEEHFKDKKTLKERMNVYEGEIPKDNPWGDELVY